MAQALFDLKVIKPKKGINVTILTNNLKKAVQDTTREMRKDMNTVTGTWTGDTKPDDWTSGKAVEKGGNLVGEVSTGSKIFLWLDLGTKTRRAVMFKPFNPKTSHRNLNSGAGMRTYRGKYYKVVGKKVPETKGIAAREFSDTIAKKHTPTLENNVRQALKNSGL